MESYIITKWLPEIILLIGKIMKFPENINQMNSSFISKAVGYALINRTMDWSNDKWSHELDIYTSYVSQVVDKLDYRNKIEGESLKNQYKTLNEASDLIDKFNLGK